MIKPKKYLVRGGEVTSIDDGQTHYISCKQLIKLYHVDPSECEVFHDIEVRPGDAREEALKRVRGLIYLYPRSDGDYDLSKCVPYGDIHQQDKTDNGSINPSLSGETMPIKQNTIYRHHRNHALYVVDEVIHIKLPLIGWIAVVRYLPFDGSSRNIYYRLASSFEKAFYLIPYLGDTHE